MDRAAIKLTIGELARAAGVGVETVRFYERRRLLAVPPRRRSGYRLYPEDAVARVRFIRSAKDLGFTLSEIAELLELRVTPGRTCADVRTLARAKIAAVEAKLAELAQIKGALETLVKSCQGRGPSADCPLLDAIAEKTIDANR
ncbi:MAG: MerR family DNA-binding protein [Deltaproteobacteria bacterium]|nr:MerR family DNA-binding protein [Deltaproteobacteria bacterium]